LATTAIACAPIEKPSLLRSASLQTTRSLQTDNAASWPADQWWSAYKDPQLDALIAEALKGSPDLKASVARMHKAQALAGVEGANGWPSLTAEGSVVSTEQSLNEGFPDQFKAVLPQGWNGHGRAALSAEYELDFFGKHRAAFAAATSRAEAAEAEAAAARLQLASAVALAYADLARLTADRAALEDVVRLRKGSADLVQQRFKAGLENEGQFSQAQSEAAGARSDLVAVKAQIANARYQLAALLGAGPDRGLEIADPQAPMLTSPALPANLSADLIGRRPDIVAARARVEAAAQRINVARASFFPNVNLTALIGRQALGVDLLGEKDSEFGSVGPAISLPIFGGGLRSQYKAAHADFDEAAALYDQTLVNSLRDVAGALADRKAADEQLTEAQTALDGAENSYRVAKLRYDGGLEGYLDVLTVENSLVTRRRAFAGMKARAFAADVELVRALGGGYVAPSSAKSGGDAARS
jgi:NodT family efflux transporter outer membrane factor (OMF) lipoprotein